MNEGVRDFLSNYRKKFEKQLLFLVQHKRSLEVQEKVKQIHLLFAILLERKVKLILVFHFFHLYQLLKVRKPIRVFHELQKSPKQESLKEI